MHIPVVSPLVKTILRIISFVIFGITILAAFGGRVDPSISALPSTLTLALPYLTILTAVITIAWICTHKFITGALGVITLLIIWTPASVAVPLNFSKKADGNLRTFKLLTYNIIHGWDQRQPDYKGNRSFEYVMNSGADIVCLQEVAEWRDYEIPNYSTFADSLNKIYPYTAGTWVNDIKVLSKYPVELANTAMLPLTSPEQKEFDIYKVTMGSNQMWLINFHMPSFALSTKDRDVVTEMTKSNGISKSIHDYKTSVSPKLSKGYTKRAECVRKMLNTLQYLNGPVILCGDFNDVPESYAYRLMTQWGLRDAYVETNFGPTFTYNEHLFFFHLDQIFYTGDLKALSVDRGTINSSDHYPLMAEFEFTVPKTFATIKNTLVPKEMSTH